MVPQQPSRLRGRRDERGFHLQVSHADSFNIFATEALSDSHEKYECVLITVGPAGQLIVWRGKNF